MENKIMNFIRIIICRLRDLASKSINNIIPNSDNVHIVKEGNEVKISVDKFSNDFTDADKEKLDRLENYVLPELLKRIRQQDVDNWNKSYQNQIESISVTGDKKKVLTITLKNGKVVKSNFNDYFDPDTDVSVNSFSFNPFNGVVKIINSDGTILSTATDGRYQLISDMENYTTKQDIDVFKSDIEERVSNNSSNIRKRMLTSDFTQYAIITDDYINDVQKDLDSFKEDTSNKFEKKLDKGGYQGSAEDLKNDIDSKVSIEQGKSLMTDAEREKLESLENYILPNILQNIQQGNVDKWNEAYNKKVKSLSVTGDVTKTITLTYQDDTILTAPFDVINLRTSSGKIKEIVDENPNDTFNYNVIAKRNNDGTFQFAVKDNSLRKYDLTPTSVAYKSFDTEERAVMVVQGNIAVIHLDFYLRRNLPNSTRLFDLPEDAPLPIITAEVGNLVGDVPQGQTANVWFCNDNNEWCNSGKSIYGSGLVSNQRYILHFMAYVQ